MRWNYVKMQEGFGLIEVMAAVAIITTGLIASLTLLQVLSRANSGISTRIVAQNLAREGVELVRAARDTNWLDIERRTATPPPLLLVDDWDRGVEGDGNNAANRDLTLILDFADGAPDTLQDSAHYNPDAPTVLWTGKKGTIVEGRYVHEQNRARAAQYTVNPSDMSVWEQSPYRRLISVYEICREIDTDITAVRHGEDQGGGNPTCDQGGGDWEKIGIQVISEVQYTERGSQHTIIVQDELYNWK